MINVYLRVINFSVHSNKQLPEHFSNFNKYVFNLKIRVRKTLRARQHVELGRPLVLRCLRRMCVCATKKSRRPDVQIVFSYERSPVPNFAHGGVHRVFR